MTEKAILFDSSRCSACKACQVACKCWNDLPSPTGLNENTFSGTYQNPVDINGDTRLIIRFNEQETDVSYKPVAWAFSRRACQHCTDAPCATVCSAGAIHVDEDTKFVTVDDSLCVGCQYCSTACPFDVPHYTVSGPLGQKAVINKCTGCLDRVEQGMSPACVTTCQSGALQFGDRDEMLALAHERVAWLQEKGFADACVYGEDEMGGLHVVQVLKYGIEAHGMVADPQVPPTVALTQIMKPITGAVTGLTVVGLAAMFALGVGYKRSKLVYNPETQDTIDSATGEVVKRGDGQDEMSVKEHIFENLPGKKGGRHE